jgi:preprotein translocase subunit SecD
MSNIIDNAFDSVLNNAMGEMNNMGSEDLKKSESKAPGLDAIIAGAAMGGLMKRQKTGNVLKDNQNLIAGAMGVMLGAGLELISPTGSKTSVVASAIAGTAALVVVGGVVSIAPQCTPVAAATFAMTSYVSMSVGRTAASYFPGDVSVDEE